MRSLLAIVSLCAALAAGIAAAETPGEVKVGETLRDATMQGLNGAPRNLSEFRGKPLLINVWASWCGPCRAEMASLERLAWLDPSANFQIIGISTDDFVDKAKAALEQSNATISHFIDHDLVLEPMLGASHLPLTVLVDADGKVIQKINGAREWDSPASVLIVQNAFRSGARPR